MRRVFNASNLSLLIWQYCSNPSKLKVVRPCIWHHQGLLATISHLCTKAD